MHYHISNTLTTGNVKIVCYLFTFFRSKNFREYKLCKYLLHEKDFRPESGMPLSAIEIEDHALTHESCSPSHQRRPESVGDVSVKSWPLVRDEFTTIHSRATSVPNMSLEMARIKSAGSIYTGGMKL